MGSSIASTFSKSRTFSVFWNPFSLNRVSRSSRASRNCSGFNSLSVTPSRSRGIKCQFKRSSSLKSKLALSSCSAPRLLTKRLLAATIDSLNSNWACCAESDWTKIMPTIIGRLSNRRRQKRNSMIRVRLVISIQALRVLQSKPAACTRPVGNIS